MHRQTERRGMRRTSRSWGEHLSTGFEHIERLGEESCEGSRDCTGDEGVSYGGEGSLGV